MTAKINDPSLSGIPELSLLVESRVEADASNICAGTDSYSQVAVSAGQIPGHLKVVEHYHEYAIQWVTPPTISGNTLTFAGKADPGTVFLTDLDGYCGQLSFFAFDAWGYHFIDSLQPYLPVTQYYAGPITGQIISYRTGEDGSFQATAELTPNALHGYQNVLLVVTSLAAVDQATNTCGGSVVMSAIEIR